MRRFAILLFGVLAATWLQFEIFPGHSYLVGGSQIYLPVLERLDSPGYLSRDLVATNTDVSYTIYDEVTLFLHEAGRLKFRTALQGQQVFCRAAALTGVLLLGLSVGLDDSLALLIAVLISFGTTLYGPCVSMIDREPVPRTFAFALILLAAGLLAYGRPLLAGLSGGTALVYDPVIAVPFWVIAVVACVFDSRLRKLLRPALTILAIFILLLANMAQLQPGVVESKAILSKIALPIARVQQYRTPAAWVSLWAPADLWSYLAIVVCGIWATARSWPILTRMLRWLLIGLPALGLLSLPASYVALERLRWQLVSQIEPAQAVIFSVAFSAIACGVAGGYSAMARKRGEAVVWLLIVLGIAVHSRVFDFLELNKAASLLELAICVSLAIAITHAFTAWPQSRWRYASLLVPVIAAFAFTQLPESHHSREEDLRPILDVANWAETSTWGSSMFLFPDAGHESYPGVFRAASRRAVWVDWGSGKLVNTSDVAAVEWQDRWEQTMQQKFSPERLQNMLSLPIDYYVLKRADRLESVRPVFRNREFFVYDASDLRRLTTLLSLTAHQSGG